MTKRTCKVAGCNNKHSGRGVCITHYRRQHLPEVAAVIEPSPLDRTPMRVGLSYRQLDHWTRRGYLIAENPDCGSGRDRTYAESEIAIAARMKELVDRGYTVAAAARVARKEAIDLSPVLLTAVG